MRNLGKTNDLVVLKGDFEKGVYKEQLLSEYTNNPFIEALPPIFNEDDVLERFMVTPRISDQDKLSETNIRYHVLKRVKNFIQPLPIHFEVKRRLSTLIRRGYLARNPLDRTFLERVRVLHELREEEETAHRYIAQKLFKRNFRQARRAASDGAIIWDRMDENSEEWEFFLETLWELQCLKTHSELTGETKKAFYYECQGITAVAVNLFILAQERVLFDEDNLAEIITPQVLKKTAREDMQTIQPMMTAIRTNNFADMMKYEHIMINLDEVMLNHKRNTEMTGRIQEAFKVRQNTIEYKRQDMIGNLSVEVAALGIFDSLKENDIKKLAQNIVERNPLDTEFNQLKSDVIQRRLH